MLRYHLTRKMTAIFTSIIMILPCTIDTTTMLSFKHHLDDSGIALQALWLPLILKCGCIYWRLKLDALCAEFFISSAFYFPDMAQNLYQVSCGNLLSEETRNDHRRQVMQEVLSQLPLQSEDPPPYPGPPLTKSPLICEPTVIHSMFHDKIIKSFCSYSYA